NRDDCSAPAKKKTEAPTDNPLTSLNTWILDSLRHRAQLVRLRNDGCPSTTQHSLQVADQALPGEINSLGSNEKFHVINS
ncbi:MAG TPA: hypothetical protein DIW81_16000, partial [Planctomycetaceae bacterium]|nr:hypothetical protein [Planctomycetaceae bacterium]